MSASLLISNDKGVRLIRSEKPDDLYIVPVDLEWNFLDVPRVYAKETAAGLTVPPAPSYIPANFPRISCHKGIAGPRPNRQKEKRKRLSRRITNKRKTDPEKPEKVFKMSKSCDSGEFDIWTSKPTQLDVWPKPNLENIPPFVKNMVITNPEEWYIEYGDNNTHPNLDILFKLEDIPFYGKLIDEHTNYIGVPEDNPDSPPGPVVLTIENKTKHKQQEKLKCIIRTGEGTRRLWVPSDMSLPKSIQRLCPDLANIRWEKVKSQELCKELILMEERGILDTYKFGVLYSKDAQTENDLYAVNEKDVSEEYKKFLEFLGEKITLEGWQGFRGGLDVKTNTTGTHSIYTKMKEYEIMFHVATLLPSQEADQQRVERKRHVGNDVVVIVFLEGDKPFDVGLISSQFIRVLVIVKKFKDEGESEKYCMVVASRKEVAVHTPLLPNPPIFECDSTFHQFFLTKCINAERIALRAEDIRLKMARTNAQFLNNLVSTYLKEKKSKK